MSCENLGLLSSCYEDEFNVQSPTPHKKKTLACCSENQSEDAHRSLAPRPRCGLQNDRSDATPDVQELVVRRQLALAKEMIHRPFEHRSIPD